MCVVSAVGDHYGDRWRDKPYVQPGTYPYSYPDIVTTDKTPWFTPEVEPIITREEFDILKIQVQEMHEMLRVAQKYDDDTDQHDCEMAEKVEILRRVAEFVGVSLEDVFGPES